MARLATDRKPRPIIDNPLDLYRFLEGDEPPLGLGQSEVRMIVGWPPSTDGDDPGQMSWDGMVGYHRHSFLRYMRKDGRELVYRYEGDLAYALVIEGEEASDDNH